MQDIILRESSQTTGGGDQRSTNYITTAVPRSALQEPGWLTSLFATKLGVPVKLKRCQLSESQAFNYGAQLLMLEPDSSDLELGKSICEQLLGDVLVVRCDGQYLGLNTAKKLVK